MSNPEQFVQLFAEKWREVDPEHFQDMFHPEGQFRHPGGRLVTREENAAYWRRIKGIMPDLRLEPRDWAARGDTLFIEWTATATVRGSALEWSGVTRFVLRDGLATEGAGYFDTLPLWSAVDPGMKRGDIVAAAEAAPGSG